MKNIFKISLLFILLLPLKVFSISIWTTCNGISGDATVWEGNVFYNSNDTVYIDHLISLSGPLNLNFNTVIITKNGQLCGEYDLNIPAGSKIINYGSICANTISLQDTLLNYGAMQVAHMEITAGQFMVTNGGSLKVGEYLCPNLQNCTPTILNSENGFISSNTEAFEYFWVKDNTPINIDAKQIQVLQSGFYKVKIKKLQTDEFTDFSDSLFVNPLSVEFKNNDNLNSIKIFPNPTTGKLTINTEKFEKLDLIEIYDISGQKILNKPLFNKVESIDIENFKAGFYSIIIYSNEKKYFSKIAKI